MYNFTLQHSNQNSFRKGYHFLLIRAEGIWRARSFLVYGGGSIKKNGIYDTAMQLLKGCGTDRV